jgi:transposase
MTKKEKIMSNVSIVGIDLAKNVFALHGVSADGSVVLRRVVNRNKLTEIVAKLPPCLLGMETGSGAHEWARRFRQFGHDVRLMPPAFVSPYRKREKNDGNDAEAICEAVSRPNMRFVPIKTVEQQAVLTLHRVRQGFVVERTATINRARGLLAEFGIVLPQSSKSVRSSIHEHLPKLPSLVARALRDLYEHLEDISRRIAEYDCEIHHLARLDVRMKRLQSVPGIGAISASAIVASVGDAREFRNGRQFAAWLGLTPKQWSSGGKQRLGSISCRGDAYLRTLLVLGARAALRTAARHRDKVSRWAQAVWQRRGYHRAVTALAAKNARILWAMLARDETFRAQMA